MDSELWGRNIILGPKWTIYPNKVLFSEKHQFKFHVPFGPFYSAKLQKKFLEWIQSYDNMPFSGKNGPLAPNDFFFQENP